ncbi:hypothetical protein A2U01_0078829, partial [Trifolium medium]|nr:hypothetical protein [Trifolium medium]
MRRLFDQLPSAETTEDFVDGIKVQATLEHESVCSQSQ